VVSGSKTIPIEFANPKMLSYSWEEGKPPTTFDWSGETGSLKTEFGFPDYSFLKMHIRPSTSGSPSEIVVEYKPTEVSTADTNRIDSSLVMFNENCVSLKNAIVEFNRTRSRLTGSVGESDDIQIDPASTEDEKRKVKREKQLVKKINKWCVVVQKTHVSEWTDLLGSHLQDLKAAEKDLSAETQNLKPLLNRYKVPPSARIKELSKMIAQLQRINLLIETTSTPTEFLNRTFRVFLKRNSDDPGLSVKGKGEPIEISFAL